MKRLVILLLSVGLIGCTVEKKDPTVVIVDRKELYQITYEWAMYKEIATILYATKWNVSKEAAKAHLEAGMNDAIGKQFISWYENREKWEKK